MMNILFILRGLPDSGKSTIGQLLAPGHCYANDDYFDELADRLGKTYRDVWNPHDHHKGVTLCEERVRAALAAGVPRVAVANTFMKQQHINPYMRLATQHGYRVSTLVIERNDTYTGSNNHGVRPDTIDAMANGFQFVDRRLSRYFPPRPPLARKVAD